MVISFTDGVPTAVDGRAVSVLDAILELNHRAGAQGVGRLDMVEDRLVGIKSREVYEAPGAIALLTAHRELEDLTVERDLRAVQVLGGAAVDRAGLRRAVVLPAQAGARRVRRPRQEHVTGEIRLRLHGGPRSLPAGAAEQSLYDYALATYDTGDTFDQSLAKGFVAAVGPAQPDRAAGRPRASDLATSRPTRTRSDMTDERRSS